MASVYCMECAALEIQPAQLLIPSTSVSLEPPRKHPASYHRVPVYTARPDNAKCLQFLCFVGNAATGSASAIFRVNQTLSTKTPRQSSATVRTCRLHWLVAEHAWELRCQLLIAATAKLRSDLQLSTSSAACINLSQTKRATIGCGLSRKARLFRSAPRSLSLVGESYPQIFFD